MVYRLSHQVLHRELQVPPSLDVQLELLNKLFISLKKDKQVL